MRSSTTPRHGLGYRGVNTSGFGGGCKEKDAAKNVRQRDRGARGPRPCWRMRSRDFIFLFQLFANQIAFLQTERRIRNKYK